jgi:hypothetical protein
LVEETSDSVQNLKELIQMVPHGVSFLAAPDLNGDGIPSNVSRQYDIRMLGKSDVVEVDFNGDGKPDLTVTTTGGSASFSPRS